jgi:hypothetical protein
VEDSAMTITMPIDKRTAAVLKAKGFTISVDGKVAKIRGEMALDITRLSQSTCRTARRSMRQ